MFAHQNVQELEFIIDSTYAKLHALWGNSCKRILLGRSKLRGASVCDTLRERREAATLRVLQRSTRRVLPLPKNHSFRLLFA